MEKMDDILALLTWLDYLGLSIFVLCWIGYRYIMERGERGRRGLIGITHEYRLAWARETFAREIPVADASLVNNLMSSVSFYASTTIYIIAGLFALIGAVDRLEIFSQDIPFAQESSSGLLELKLILLIVIFVTAYFKFTWSLRQFNVLCILIGGTPNHRNISDPQYFERAADRMARINSIAGNEFNRGIRAYYYGIAATAWFLHPLALIVTTVWITGIIYSRDYKSPALKAIRDDFPPAQRDVLNETYKD